MDTSPQQLTDRLAAAFAAAGHATARPWLWPALLQLLSRGEPVTTAQLADATGRTEDEVRQALATLPDTEYDAAGRIVGSGITLNPTPHRFTVDGRQLFTWCALDTLVFPAVLDRVAQVESPCRTTGAPVRLTVEPDRVTRTEPAAAVVSLVTPDDLTAVRSAFCNHVHFFASDRAAAPWLARHPEATTVPVAQALAVGRPLATAFQQDPGPAGCC
ncbi:alkylmercury lyase [Streptomyces albidoflavus]|uniref:organomercurial lyase MerB n=1 Tax=Streptomyces albidoflavus TaxID=1886 RepID=UPI000BAE6245|nr:organomercurial lyase MerB [Streptomyces albidoflavus]PAX83380.1 alkylmercury lyase [Streptomyces albidoflavus]PBO20205.1 alkylmercury lyase [Streptomyces albidoflavus]PBO23468.1 alkylmercury lyase [Streptomyces albidoflavus]PBO28937.1 alkylmercury lyase [Streptomyces albidoflavus]